MNNLALASAYLVIPAVHAELATDTAARHTVIFTTAVLLQREERERLRWAFHHNVVTVLTLLCLLVYYTEPHTCKCFMFSSIFTWEVKQFSGMYLKLLGQGSWSTPFTQGTGMSSYPRDTSLKHHTKQSHLWFTCSFFFIFCAQHLIHFDSNTFQTCTTADFTPAEIKRKADSQNVWKI